MRRLPLAAASCLLALLPAGTAPGQEWARFRGPNGSGLAEGTLPARWDEGAHNWKVRLPGSGHSSPVVWGDRLFLSGAEEDGKRLLLCLRAGDGKQLWSRTFPGERSRAHAHNSLSSSTPAADERHVYACWAGPKDFLVVALDHGGKEVWRADLGPFRAGHGFGASPIVHGGLVVVPNDQDGKSELVALDSATGRARWKVPRRSKASYTTPCVYQPRGGPAELIFTNYEHGVTSVDPKSGKVNWELDVFDKGHVEAAIASPVVASDLILATCGWLGVRQEVVAVRPPRPGSGGKATEAYRITRSAPLCTTPLVRGALLFLWDDNGVVTCADVRTGTVHWRQRAPGSYYSSPVCVGEHLYNVSRAGDVVVVRAAKRYELLARNRLGEGSHSTPAVAGGRMYVRTFSHLLCFGGKEAGR